MFRIVVVVAALLLCLASPCAADPLGGAGFMQSSLGLRVRSYIARQQREAKVVDERAARGLRMVDLYPTKQVDVTRYGFNVLERTVGHDARFMLRTGISKVSSSAAGGLELIVNW